MLYNRSLNDKTYEELISEALAQIPLYSQEWTNYNPSDPGITILENLTAYGFLQQNQIDQITPRVRQKLLKMAGFEPEKGHCARVLLAAEGLTEPLSLPVNQKFTLGGLCFETGKSLELKPCHISGIFGMRDGERYDCSYLTDREVNVPAYVFGKKPKAGDSIWFTADAMPDPGEEIIFYMTVADRYNRNPFAEKGNNTFAGLKWECYTEKGFEEMNVRDGTGCFLISGEVRVRLPEDAPAPCPEADGQYALRATLTWADYDVRPKLTAVEGFLFEAQQKNTRAVCYTFQKNSSVSLRSDLLKEGAASIFCKEEKGASYRRYMPAYPDAGQGRFCEETVEEDGTRTWSFHRRKYGFGPGRLKNAVKVVVYSEEIVRRYYLGTVLGYDHQEIRLPMQHIVADSFCIIAKRQDAQGELYDFVRPSRYEPDNLTYYLYENEGRIVIENAGAFIGAELYVGTLSVTEGPEGNVRAGNRFAGEGLDQGISFYNPKPGTGGAFRETLEEVARRFRKDIKTPYTAVTAADYERLVRETPELCIHKVRAVFNAGRNLVRIAVKPGTDEEFPKLSEAYRKAIERQVEDKRLLTTKVEIVPPAYMPVDVRGVVYVKNQYEDPMAQIRETVKNAIDYIHTERNFGEILKFDQVFHAIEELDCVDFIYELSLFPQDSKLAKLQDADIVPNENVLCYAGEIDLEIG